MPLVARTTLSLYADDRTMPCLCVGASSRRDPVTSCSNKWICSRLSLKNGASSSTWRRAQPSRKRRRMPQRFPPPVTLDDESIGWKPHEKYLGVILDSKLNFGPNAKRKVEEAKRIASSIEPLINRRLSLPMSVKICHKVCFHAAWWATCSKSNRKTQETIQNKALPDLSPGGPCLFVTRQTATL
ncbi:hypothetical protein J6590_001780 [Homalodisca vitripennis]|nr:hypothetical protein J6590_001780 [Homalodisca vitripennis]